MDIQQYKEIMNELYKLTIFDEKTRGFYYIFVIYSPASFIMGVSPEEFLKVTYSNFGQVMVVSKVIPEGEFRINSKGEISVEFSIDGKIITKSR